MLERSFVGSLTTTSFQAFIIVVLCCFCEVIIIPLTSARNYFEVKHHLLNEVKHFTF